MNDGQKLADQIEERLLDFAVRIIRLTKALPKDEVGKHIAKQLMRSGTSPAPNYAEARGAESRADFIHKLGIVQKELNESKIWLRMIEKAELLTTERLHSITNEAQELSRIIQASINTTRSRK
ncbi:MAG: four helix bundle protein [Puniceicoccales bacterium]